MTRVYPHPDLAAKNEYLPGIGADGAELPKKEAQDLIDRGLAVAEPPKPPDAPAEKSEDPA